MSKPVYGKNAVQSRNVEKISSYIWALVIGFIVFLVWTPFQVGLFNGQQIDFEKPIYVSSLLSSLLLLVWIGLYITKFKLEGQRDLLAVASLLLPATYALSLIGAVSHYMAMNLLFIQSMYVAIFIIALYLLQQKQLNVVIQNAILAIAYFIVGFGLLNWLGSWKFAGGLVGWFSNTVRSGKYLDAVMTDSNGLRLTSIFQYANTYAAFLMAFLFVAVFALVRSKKWYGTLTHSFMLVPIIVSLLLTLSRGGLVMLPVVFILLLLFLKPAQQILWIMHLAISGIAALLVTSPLTTLGTELNTTFTSSAALKAWAYLLVASAVVAALGWANQRFAAPWLQEKLGSWETRKLTGLWIPLGSIVLVAIVAFLLIGTSVRSILPDNIETRLENINFKQHSVLERITFYKDAMKVVKDYPIIGSGGGGWASLYEHYQNNPYVSRQVHNFFLQYLIEVGIVGFIVFMGFIGYIFYKYIRAYLKRDKDEFNNGFFFYIIALSILVHSLLDFNMSYAFMGILVFIGLAGMGAGMDNKPLRQSWNKAGLRFGYFAVLAIGSVFLLFLSISYIGSSNAALKGKNLVSVSQSYEEIKTPLVEALKSRPFQPEAAIYLASLDLTVFKQTQDEQYLAEAYNVLSRALKDEPYNKDLLKQLISYYDLKGQNDLGFNVYRDNADKFNWDIDWYEALIRRAQAFAAAANVQKDEAKKQEYLTAGLEAYQHVVDGVEHLKTLPPEQLQGRPFSITPTIALNAGKLQLLSGQAEQAAATLKLGFADNYADIVSSTTLWDTNWYSSLIARAFELAQQSFTQQDEANKIIHINIGLDAYNQVASDLQGQPLPSSINLNAGKLQYMAGQVQAAAATLKLALSDDYSDAANRDAARWYLAALKKTGAAQDQPVYDKLIAADPSEAAEIDVIANKQY
ncbi:O-antigen ligase family protein [Paenibacillus sp. FSL E2-0178]|uniref:O-antigen ligase family protein n=1 Tax=Paenibacillus sp. FSL E2-0178 TaxID=2921361 RepID=UPI0031591396